jgi:hypothetical protein
VGENKLLVDEHAFVEFVVQAYDSSLASLESEITNGPRVIDIVLIDIAGQRRADVHGGWLSRWLHLLWYLLVQNVSENTVGNPHG